MAQGDSGTSSTLASEASSPKHAETETSGPRPREPPYFMDANGYVYAQEFEGAETRYLGPLLLT